MGFADINWLAVLVAGLAYLGIGAAWYSNIMFAKPWMAALGKTEEDANEFNAPAIALLVVTGLITAVILALALQWIGAPGAWHGALIGLTLALGLKVTVHLVNYIFDRRSARLLMINSGHDLVELGVMGAIIGAWPGA